MQKTAPTFGRLAAMVIFALSCFGLLLYLWLSFGGTVPLKPKGYRFQVAFPEATQLGPEADVRIAGVTVGRVREKKRDPRSNRTLASIEVERKYAPIPSDMRAILRQKTLLGETYVELTPGTARAPKLAEGARLSNTRVQGTVEFDEILDTFDAPTRRAFRIWQQQTGAAVEPRSQDLNDALGELPVFLDRGTDLMQTLDTDRRALGRLVKNTGVVFGALTEREQQLHNLIVNTHDVFQTTARHEANLAKTISILPTFLDESRRTFRRTQRFSAHARPVVQLLRSPTRKLAPTVADLHVLAPDLTRTFNGIKQLVPVSKTGLPALSDNLRGLQPFFGSLGPFLSELNPVFEQMEDNQNLFTDFWSGGGAGLSDTLHSSQPDGVGHYLRAFGPNGIEGAGIYRSRLANNRGDAYIQGVVEGGPEVTKYSIAPSWDCNKTGFGEGKPQGVSEEDASKDDNKPGAKKPGCWVAPPIKFQGRLSKYPHVERDDYSKSG